MQQLQSTQGHGHLQTQKARGSCASPGRRGGMTHPRSEQLAARAAATAAGDLEAGGVLRRDLGREVIAAPSRP